MLLLMNDTNEYVMESVFSKASGPSYKWWKSPRRGMWRSMLLASGRDSLFLVAFLEITISGSEGACDGVWF